MTAEVAILTRSAVALAADSAVTVGQERVWKNTNKLFSLSNFNDIGIMIYGGGDFCGVSWEVIIKQFRKHIGRRRFEKLSECVDCFIDYINTIKIPVSELSHLNIYLLYLKLLSECYVSVTSRKSLERRRQFEKAVDDKLSNILKLEILKENVMKRDFIKMHSRTIIEMVSGNENRKFHLTNRILSKVVTLCYEASRRKRTSSYETGIVFSGFGDGEILPVLFNIIVDGRCCDFIRAWKSDSCDFNDENSHDALVIPFAQSDISYLFMEGVHPNNIQFLTTTIYKTLEKLSGYLIEQYLPPGAHATEKKKQRRNNVALTHEFMEQFSIYRRDEIRSKMLSVISALPKEEIAAMAEALVEITSLRRKIDSKLESVGGPVDVAIISKSDGFVWIKRKHYFSMDLNKDFMVRWANRFEGEA